MMLTGYCFYNHSVQYCWNLKSYDVIHSLWSSLHHFVVPINCDQLAVVIISTTVVIISTMMRDSVLFKICLLLFHLWHVGGAMPNIDDHPSDDTEDDDTKDDVSGSGSDEDEIPCCNIGD